MTFQLYINNDIEGLTDFWEKYQFRDIDIKNDLITAYIKSCSESRLELAEWIWYKFELTDNMIYNRISDLIIKVKLTDIDYLIDKFHPIINKVIESNKFYMSGDTIHLHKYLYLRTKYEFSSDVSIICMLLKEAMVDECKKFEPFSDKTDYYFILLYAVGCQQSLKYVLSLYQSYDIYILFRTIYQHGSIINLIDCFNLAYDYCLNLYGNFDHLGQDALMHTLYLPDNVIYWTVIKFNITTIDEILLGRVFNYCYAVSHTKRIRYLIHLFDLKCGHLASIQILKTWYNNRQFDLASIQILKTWYNNRQFDLVEWSLNNRKDITEVDIHR